uniref:Uncharacterized protein n=1 Tax=Proboscia inermis TaxID=420281 RepID=A0A7S0CI12_9STRA|mmetsp:Transcript_46499/g.46964  ORF Transcript_46499/g.46964 Transcript_46499/m.46964 type:complete len:128 (+) Transcript_46499:87-470(+)
MVAVAPNNIHLQESPYVAKEISTKQLKRLEGQKARETKKMAKRQAKAIQKERNAIKKELKQDERERNAEQEQIMNQGLSGKEMEEQKRQREEDALFQEFIKEEPKTIVDHTKKSFYDSNRLGGSSMA